MSKYKYITGQNIGQIKGKKLKHIKTGEEFIAVRVQGNFITLYNKNNIPEIFTPQYIKNQFAVLEG